VEWGAERQRNDPTGLSPLLISFYFNLPPSPTSSSSQYLFSHFLCSSRSGRMDFYEIWKLSNNIPPLKISTLPATPCVTRTECSRTLENMKSNTVLKLGVQWISLSLIAFVARPVALTGNRCTILVLLLPLGYDSMFRYEVYYYAP
jgi:hypothetical protein